MKRKHGLYWIKYAVDLFNIVINEEEGLGLRAMRQQSLKDLAHGSFFPGYFLNANDGLLLTVNDMHPEDLHKIWVIWHNTMLICGNVVAQFII